MCTSPHVSFNTAPKNRYLKQKLEFKLLRVEDPVNGRPSSGTMGLIIYSTHTL